MAGRELDHEGARAALDACLLTPAELEQQQAWRSERRGGDNPLSEMDSFADWKEEEFEFRSVR